jgi:gliding motility-associated-like protein
MRNHYLYKLIGCDHLFFAPTFDFFMESLMTRFATLFLNSRITIFCVLLCLFAYQSFSQSCNCPATCGACTGGGLIKIELKFNQPIAQTISVSDGQGAVFSGLVPALGIVSLLGAQPNGRFAGDQLTIKVNGAVDVFIDTKCNSNIQVGDTFGSFTVVGGVSKTGGSICCNAFVAEAIRPTISNCPTNVSIDVFDQTCSASISWIPPIAADNCQIVSFTEQSGLKPGDSFGLGRKQLVYTATDNTGLSRDCVFEIKRIDKAPPVFTSFPSDITAFARNSCNSDPGAVTWALPTAQDCDGLFLTPPPLNSGDRFPLGETIVTYSATDGSGNKTSASFKVTVIDDAKPTINKRPANITAEAQDCGAFITPWIEPIADDNCTLGVTLTSDHKSNEKFPIGITIVTYTAKDASGNLFSYGFNVKVEDTTKPIISALPDKGELLTASCDVAVTWAEPTVTDNCSFTLSSSHHSGDLFPLGTTVVSYTAIDGSQNQSTVSFNVVVTDQSAPIFTNCPPSIIEKEADPITCKAKVNWAIPVATDNCLDPSKLVSPTNKPGDDFPIGTTTLTYLAFDKAGNSASCVFAIVVKDKTAPVISSQPSDETLDANTSCVAVANWVLPTAADACSSPVVIISDHKPNESFPLGITKVTYTATDNIGNVSELFFNIAVKDNSAPIFNNCPKDIIAQANSSCEAVVSWEEPTARDNCSGDIIPTSNFKPGDAFEVGKPTTVTYDAVDAAGNKSTCHFIITVVNESVAVIENCPKEIIVKTDETGKAIVTWDEPTASDRCGTVVLKASRKPGSEFEIGTTNVIYESLPNSAGKVSRCEFNVILSYKEIAIDIGKAITPDGDRINDTWMINGIENFKDNEVIVVDRWGNKIFEALHYDNSKVVWSGTNLSGAIVPTGTYFYSISVSFRGNHVDKKGSVEVIQ